MTSKTDERIRGTARVPPQPTHFEELKKAVEDAISDGEDGHGLWFKVTPRMRSALARAADPAVEEGRELISPATQRMLDEADIATYTPAVEESLPRERPEAETLGIGGSHGLRAPAPTNSAVEERFQFCPTCQGHGNFTVNGVTYKCADKKHRPAVEGAPITTKSEGDSPH